MFSSEVKPIAAADNNSQFYNQSDNDSAVLSRLYHLNQEQIRDLDKIEASKNIYAREEEFVTLLLTIEGERLSKELFGLMFDLVSATIHFNSHHLPFI